MPVATRHAESAVSESPEVRRNSPLWILNAWKDLALIVAPPVFIVPVVLMLQARLSRASLDMFSILVAGVGSLGHHLPGMIRAYGDPELFRRFRLRFIFAPLFLLAVCIPLSQYNLAGMLLILLVWGYWHGLMQVYGFSRIYDVKAGSTSTVTAYLDWLLCLVWFSAGLVFSDARMAHFLDTLYTGGGPLLPSHLVGDARLLLAVATAVISVCFLVNYAWQWRWGQRPSPIKLLMLASGIGCWWFSMVYVQNVLLGIAVFEIFHDVQYLAIVWVYNRKRVEKSGAMGVVMRHLFRRDAVMISIYVAVVLAYGFISIFASAAPSDEVRKLLTGLIWASGILHFYYDGFIWKVREKSVRESLGLTGGQSTDRSRPFVSGELVHLLKWSPFVVLLGAMTCQELIQSDASLPGATRRTWSSEASIRWHESIVGAVPANLASQARLAAILDNCGRTDEAKMRLSKTLGKHPNFVEGHLLLGQIHARLEEWGPAIKCFQQAIQGQSREFEQVQARFHLAEIYYKQGRFGEAQREFQELLRIDPGFSPALEAIKVLARMGESSESEFRLAP